MAYTLFDYTKPNAGTQNGTAALASTLSNLLALRDGVQRGSMPGWTFVPSGGTADKPTQLLFSKGTERLKCALTWGTTGGASGNVTVATWSYSSNSGSSYSTISTDTYTYDTAGNCTGSTPS